MWHCAQCETENEESAAQCIICGERRVVTLPEWDDTVPDAVSPLPHTGLFIFLAILSFGFACGLLYWAANYPVIEWFASLVWSDLLIRGALLPGALACIGTLITTDMYRQTGEDKSWGIWALPLVFMALASFLMFIIYDIGYTLRTLTPILYGLYILYLVAEGGLRVAIIAQQHRRSRWKCPACGRLNPWSMENCGYCDTAVAELEGSEDAREAPQMKRYWWAVLTPLISVALLFVPFPNTFEFMVSLMAAFVLSIVITQWLYRKAKQRPLRSFGFTLPFLVFFIMGALALHTLFYAMIYYPNYWLYSFGLFVLQLFILQSIIRLCLVCFGRRRR